MLDQVRAKLDPASPEEPESTLNKPVFFISAGLIIAVCLYGALFSEHASLVFSDLQSWLLTNLGWLYMGSVAGFFMLVIYLAFSRFAHLRLGADDSEPEYSYGSSRKKGKAPHTTGSATDFDGARGRSTRCSNPER